MATGETLDNHTAEETRALSKVLGTIRVVIHRRFGGQKLGLQKEPVQMHGDGPRESCEWPGHNIITNVRPFPLGGTH